MQTCSIGSIIYSGYRKKTVQHPEKIVENCLTYPNGFISEIIFIMFIFFVCLFFGGLVNNNTK